MKNQISLDLTSLVGTPVGDALSEMPEAPAERLAWITELLHGSFDKLAIAPLLVYIVDQEKLYSEAGYTTLNSWATETFSRHRESIRRWRKTGSLLYALGPDAKKLTDNQIKTLTPLTRAASEPNDLKNLAVDSIAEAKGEDGEIVDVDLKLAVSKALPVLQKKEPSIRKMLEGVAKKLESAIEYAPHDDLRFEANELLQSIRVMLTEKA